MPLTYSIFFISTETRMRAKIASELSAHGWQVVPGENYAEIAAQPKNNAVVLCALEHGGEIADIHEQMERSGEWLPVISCSRAADYGMIVEAIRAGSQGHLVVPFEADRLAAILAGSGERMRKHIEQRKIRHRARRRLEPLSPRERDVLEAMARLGSNKKIAMELDLSPRTVEIYRSKIMQRLGVDHIAQALWLAFQSGDFGTAMPAPEAPEAPVESRISQMIK